MTRRLLAVPTGLLSPVYELREGDAVLGSLEYRSLSLRTKGMVFTAGQQFSVSREGVLRANYMLVGQDDLVRATAGRHGITGTAFQVACGAFDILLRKKLLALRESYILSDAGEEVGLIARESLVSRQMTIRLDERAAGMPAELILFLTWIAVMIHRSDDGSPA